MAGGEAMVLHEYRIELDEDERHFTVEGPNEDLCYLIGERFKLACATEEGKLLLTSAEMRRRLPEFFHIPEISTTALATAAQICYARDLGFPVSDGATADEIGFYLKDFEQVRFYVYYVLRNSKSLAALAEAADCRDLVYRVIQRILQNPEMVVVILSLMTRQNATGREPPRSGDTFRAVTKLLKSKH
jgi:hypothetical protein